MAPSSVARSRVAFSMQKSFFNLENDSFRGVLWAFLYALMVVVVSPTALDIGISRYAVAAAALVIFPALASLILWFARRFGL